MECAFESKVAVVTSVAKGIGRCFREEFEKQGTNICVVDLLVNSDFASGISIINISSSRDRMRQPQSESYTAVKVASLL